MENKINIAELLKNCPKGTKLYSPVCGECRYWEISKDGNIALQLPVTMALIFLSPRGRCLQTEDCEGAECLLFPSEKMRHWTVFQAKYVRGGINAKEILEANGAVLLCEEYDYEDTNEVYYIDRLNNNAELALLSEKEYLLLNGTELKLEEEQPKFKVGDVVTDTDSRYLCLTNEPTSENFIGKVVNAPKNVWRLATPSEIAEWNKEVLEPKHWHYSKSKRKIIHWFLPFDKVLTRDFYSIGESNENEGNAPTPWVADFFSHKDPESDGFYTIGGTCAEVIPYNEVTASLLGTTDDWKED